MLIPCSFGFSQLPRVHPTQVSQHEPRRKVQCLAFKTYLVCLGTTYNASSSKYHRRMEKNGLPQRQSNFQSERTHQPKDFPNQHSIYWVVADAKKDRQTFSLSMKSARESTVFIFHRHSQTESGIFGEIQRRL